MCCVGAESTPIHPSHSADRHDILRRQHRAATQELQTSRVPARLIIRTVQPLGERNPPRSSGRSRGPCGESQRAQPGRPRASGRPTARLARNGARGRSSPPSRPRGRARKPRRPSGEHLTGGLHDRTPEQLWYRTRTPRTINSLGGSEQERPAQSLPWQIILEPAPPAMAPDDSSGLVLELGAYEMSATSPCAPTVKFEVIRRV